MTGISHWAEQGPNKINTGILFLRSDVCQYIILALQLILKFVEIDFDLILSQRDTAAEV